MRFKTITLLILSGLTSSVFAQHDSTDLNLTTTDFIPQSTEDFLTYGTGNLVVLSVEFEIDDLPTFGKVRIELIRHVSGSQVAVYSTSYTLAELNEADFIDESLVQIDLPPVDDLEGYEIAVRIEDTVGHQKILITKYVQP
jgi:hypothetical protein